MIGQFNLGFIIGKLDEDLFIVDQVSLASLCIGVSFPSFSSIEPVSESGWSVMIIFALFFYAAR